MNGFSEEESIMTIKESTRFVFLMYLLVVVAVCLYLLTTMLGLLPSEYLTRIATSISGGNISARMFYFVVLIVVIVTSFRFMFFGSKKERPETALIASYDNGMISIAVGALEDLAKKFIKQTESVKVEAINIFSLGEQVEIDIKIRMLSEVNLPQITQQLQSGLIQYIETSSGIKVAQVKIMVASIDESIKENEIIESN